MQTLPCKMHTHKAYQNCYFISVLSLQRDCKLDGYGGHSVNIRDACILVDNSPADEVYDYTVRLSDVKYFIDVKKTKIRLTNQNEYRLINKAILNIETRGVVSLRQGGAVPR